MGLGYENKDNDSKIYNWTSLRVILRAPNKHYLERILLVLNLFFQKLHVELQNPCFVVLHCLYVPSLPQNHLLVYKPFRESVHIRIACSPVLPCCIYKWEFLFYFYFFVIIACLEFISTLLADPTLMI